MNIELLKSAREDLLRGYQFYESQSRNLGSYFVDSLMSDIDSLYLNGGIHPFYNGFHKLIAHKFPYAIYYKQLHGTIQVYAVLDCRQNPVRVDKRLT